MEPSPLPNAPTPADSAVPTSGPAPRPGGLLAVLVLAVVLGGGGTCSGAMGLGGALLEDTVSELQARTLSIREGIPGTEVQVQLLERLRSVQEAWLPWQLADAALGPSLSLLLLVGTILGFS